MSDREGIEVVNRLFIVGCAKTGTTLLQRCFASFGDMYLIFGEQTLDHFVVTKPLRGNMVGKRSQGVVFSDDLTDAEIERQLGLVREHDVKLICMVRDREDTLKSDNGWVLPARYDACMEQLEKYRNDVDICVVNYEGLVGDPDSIQKQLANRFGLKIIHKFSDYPDFVPEIAFEIVNHNKLYRARRIGERV